MEFSYHAKLELVKSALSDSSERNGVLRAYLFEGVFWLLELMEDEITKSKIPKQEYLKTFIRLLEDETSKCAKDVHAHFDGFTLSEAYSRLRMFGPREPDSPTTEQ